MIFVSSIGAVVCAFVTLLDIGVTDSVSSLSDVVWISLIVIFLDEENPIVVLVFISVGDVVTFGFVAIVCGCTEV